MRALGQFFGKMFAVGWLLGAWPFYIFFFIMGFLMGLFA